MERGEKILICAGLSLVAGLFYHGVKGKRWEAQQEKQYFKKTTVSHIEPPSISNTLTGSTSKYAILLEGMDRPISYSKENWDPSVKKGSTVWGSFQPSYFTTDHFGHTIDDHMEK